MGFNSGFKGLRHNLQTKASENCIIEFHYSYLSPNIFREVKTRARLAGQAAGRGEIGSVPSGKHVG